MIVTGTRWRTVQELFLAAREVPADAREAHLRDACGGDASLRAEVERLLAADAGEGILDRPAPGHAVSSLVMPTMVDDAPVQQRVGPYLVSGEIGRGGMGTVYRAYDPRLRRDVALKFLPAGWHQDPAAKARFIDEARAASALDHPHTCPVYDIGSTDDGRIYIAMAYCAGGSLAARLATGPMPVDQAVRVAVQVASALDRAHEAGIVHRDVKPANIAFTEHGEARVLDFGIAVLGTDEWEAPRIAAGTPAYMAPEQVRGEAVDRRTDVWALGVVLYEMLTGSRPFTGGGEQAAPPMFDEAPNDVRARRPDVPLALAAAVSRALAKDPAARFATAADFSAAITAAMTATVTSAGEGRSRRRRLTRIAAAAGIVALGAAAGLYADARRTRAARVAAGVDANAVAILPFRVRGEPSIGYLREGMADLLAAKLTGEGGLRAVDPRAVYAGWRRAVTSERDDLPLDSAVTLATRLGAGSVLVGDVVGTAATVVVNASIRNARGKVTASATAQGTHAELSTLVDRLVAHLLSTSSGEEQQRLAALTSTSLPALRAYLEGQAAYRRGRYGEALEEFSRALDLDSTFALAGLGLVLADGWVGTGHAGERGRAAAWRWRDRLSARDHALLVAHVGAAFPRPPTIRERLAATESALRLAPDRVELWYELGDLHFHFGRIVGAGDWETQAERALRRAVQSDSAFAAPIHHLVGLYARQRRREDLRAIVGATRAGLEGPTADFVRWRAAVALGEPAPDSLALDSMATETIGWIGMISQDDGVVRPLGEHALRLRHGRPSTREERFERHLSLHAVALNGGRPRAATALAETVRELQPDSSLHLRLRVLAGLYGDGDRPAAAEAASALGARRGSRLDRCVRAQWLVATGDPSAGDEPGTPGGTAAERLCEATVDAMLALRRGDPSAAGAIARVDELLRSGLTEFFLGDGLFDYASIALARLLEATGDRAGALTALRRRPYFIGWQPFLASSLRYEGQLAAALGDRDGAVRAYEHHLALRHDPEPALRAATDSARAELARISAGR
jgi:tetratricopeptide (TPR) repeat protein